MRNLMIKHAFILLFAFIIGCVITLAARTAWYKPHAGHTSPAPATDYAPMVNNTPPQPDVKAATASHQSHEAPVPSTKTVNTRCPICGMEVDPELPTAIYDGKTIGFGCGACPGKFAANPERYGPAALRNETIRN
ncbi:MAG: hypothetical protein SFY80_13290 [Verrucomicrobiota bacterium]|nr:hypothetical protein [Verrucomicrobiota bacterium]